MTATKSADASFRGIAALCATLAFLVAGAQAGVPDPESPYTELTLRELMQLEVFTSASLLPTRVSKAPGTVYSFNRSDFAHYGVRRVEDLLQFVPGLQVNQYRKRHRSIWSRGMLDRYNDKMILLVDGIRRQHLYYGHFALGENFPLENIEKVEVILGPASSLYGANAFGGIISITTRDFSAQPGVEINVEAGNHDRRKASALFNSPALLGFASYLEQDAPFSEDRRSFIGGSVLQPLDEEFKRLSIKARPFQGLTLTLDHARNDTPFLFIPNTQDAFVEERYTTASASYQTGNLQTGQLEAAGYFTHDHAREYELEQVAQTLGYEEFQNADIAGVRVTGLRQFDTHTLAIGASWQYEAAEKFNFERRFSFNTGFINPSLKGSLLKDPEIENNDYAVFIQDVWQIRQDLELTLGLRYDDFDQFKDYTNYRAALVYSANEQETWKLMYGTAIRTPSFREYLKVLEGTSFTAPNPMAERLQSLEIAYLRQWEQASLSINLYDNKAEDFIVEAPTPDNADEYFSNSDTDWHLYGAETGLRYKPSQALDLRLGLAWLNAKRQGIAGDLPYLATWSGNLSISYTLRGGHVLGLSAIYNADREDTNSIPGDDARAFAIANIFLSGPLTSSLSYQVGVENLFDRRVQDPAADFGTQYNTERSERQIWLRLQWNPSR